ncbi:MAG: toluene-4-monooxygenase system B family protein [Solirubrobacteraceae bacterium]
MLPLCFRFDGDFLVHYMSVEPDATVGDISEAAAGFVSGFRVPVRAGALQLTFAGAVHEPDKLASDVGIGELDFVQVDVVPAG